MSKSRIAIAIATAPVFVVVCLSNAHSSCSYNRQDVPPYSALPTCCVCCHPISCLCHCPLCAVPAFSRSTACPVSYHCVNCTAGCNWTAYVTCGTIFHLPRPQFRCFAAGHLMLVWLTLTGISGFWCYLLSQLMATRWLIYAGQAPWLNERWPLLNAAINSALAAEVDER